MQEQVEIIVPITEKRIVLRGYVTGDIDAQLQRIILKGYDYKVGITPDMNTDSQDSTTNSVEATIDSTSRLDAEYRGVELMVISVDGVTEKVAKLIYALPKGDTDVVIAKINEISAASKVTPDQKKTSLESTSQA